MKNFLQTILKAFGFKVLTQKEYDDLINNNPTNPERPKTLLSYKKVVSMLREYDNTRFEILVNNLGFEDTRVNTFDFYEMKNYLAYVESIAAKKGIKLSGISFVKGVYNEEIVRNKDFVKYENLLYLPTAIVKGEEMLIDLENSTKENLVTLKEKLAEYGYEWRYDNLKNYKVRVKQKGKQKKRRYNTTIIYDNERQ